MKCFLENVEVMDLPVSNFSFKCTSMKFGNFSFFYVGIVTVLSKKKARKVFCKKEVMMMCLKRFKDASFW
jgi:hypothetical protein